MKKGDWVNTPRFSKVKIQKVFRSEENARKSGYTEPTHYNDWEYAVLGKHTGINRMVFAAAKINQGERLK